MAILPMRRNPLTSMLNFAADRDREAASLGDVISQIAKPVLSGMGIKTDEMTPQPAVMRGPAPAAQPLGPMTGPAMAPTPVMSKEELKANVFPGESGGDYNALFGYANRPGGKFEGVNLTDMTVDEVIEFTDPKGPYGQWVKNQIGRVATPTGAFQVVGTTLKDAVRGLGLTGDEPYNEATQDAIGMWIYENQGPEAWEGWRKGGSVSGGAGSTSVDGGAGADTLGTGGNVEDILAQLYPQMSPEEEKKQRRKDFFAAASQGLSALSQGRPQDFSNIRQMQEQRRTQAVQDMRERERARAAANLVFSQTGDRDLTAAVVTGAISYNDVVSERERKRVEAEADRVRLQQEQANGRLANIVENMWPELGLPDSVKDEVLSGIAAGDDPDTIFTLNEKAKVAEAARKVEEQEAEAAETRAAAIEAFSTQGGPIEQYAARLMALDPTITTDQALSRASELVGPPKDYVPSEATKTWTDSRAIAESRGPEALAEFDAKYPTAADFEMARSGRLGGVTSTVDTMNADLIPKGLTVVPDPANPTQPLIKDGQIVTTEIQGGPAQQDRLAREQAAAEEAAKQSQLADKAVLREQQDVVRSNDTMRLLSDVYDRSLSFMGGAVPSAARGLIADLFAGSEAGQAKGQLQGVKVGIFIDQLAGMRESSPTGAAVGNVTEGEREAMASAYGELNVGGDPDVLRQNLRAIANAGLDLQFGTPEALRKAVEEGRLDAETAERYGARYDIDGTADTGMAGDLGPVVPLGLTVVDENVLATAAPVEGVSPDSPDPEFEARLLQNPDLITSMTLEDYKALSPEQKAVFDRLAEGD